MSVDYYSPSGRMMSDALEWARTRDGEVPTGLPGGFRIGDTYCWFGRVRVSTVWLGLDHSFQLPYFDEQGELRVPPPLIFETMCFRKGSWSELYMARYHTIEQAVAGHYAAVRHARRWGWRWLLRRKHER